MFEFREQGSHAAIVHDGQEILQFDKMITYHGGPWWVQNQVMIPGGEPEVAYLPIFAFFSYFHAVSDVSYEAVAGEDSLTLTLTPTRTLQGTGLFHWVQERCTFEVRLVEGRFVWRQQLEIDVLQDLDTAQLDSTTPLPVYRFPHQDNQPGLFFQYADPQPVSASGPAVPMIRDWQWQFEPSVGPEAFRSHWRRRWVSLIFQNLDGSYAWSDLNKTKWAHLTQDNRRARPCDPQGYLYLLKENGEALQYRADAPSHYHHVCEWGMDFHFWCDLAPFLQGTVLPAGTHLEAATTVQLVGPEVTQPILAQATEMRLTEREHAKANLPAYEEPENSFTVSALERLDAQPWRPLSEGCRWEPTGAHHGDGGCLIVHNEISNEGSWLCSDLGPQQWGNPFLAGATYRLSAWVRVEDGEFDTSDGGPQVGVELMQSNGPAYVSTKEWLDFGWSEELVNMTSPVPTSIPWTQVEVTVPACPSFAIYGKLKLRLSGRGTAYFSNVRWDMVEPE
ncbi:MAG TPA: hypothetical protein VGM19_00875 [Armatimonadota bacterium]|jgi:hypothetical protein